MRKTLIIATLFRYFFCSIIRSQIKTDQQDKGTVLASFQQQTAKPNAPTRYILLIYLVGLGTNALISSLFISMFVLVSLLSFHCHLSEVLHHLVCQVLVNLHFLCLQHLEQLL